jgi:hypothetical protein
MRKARDQWAFHFMLLQRVIQIDLSDLPVQNYKMKNILANDRRQSR